MIIAERFGVIPDVIETQMSEYWYYRALALIEAESMNIATEAQLARKRKR